MVARVTKQDPLHNEKRALLQPPKAQHSSPGLGLLLLLLGPLLV